MHTHPNYCLVPLSGEDVATMRKLLAVFAEAFEDLQSYARAQPDDSYLAERLSDPTFIAIAALSGATVVGGLTAYVLRKFEQARSEVYIYDLAVLESHRRRGIATASIQELKKIAHAKGAYAIFVQADPEDEAAVNLYSKFGTRQDVFHFDIPPARLP